MGYIAHDAVIAVVNDYRRDGLPDVDAFRAAIPDYFRPLVIGPVTCPLNGYVAYVFLPDGSKERWNDSDLGDTLRVQFRALFQPENDDVVSLRFGGDFGVEHGPEITAFDPEQP